MNIDNAIKQLEKNIKELNSMRYQFEEVKYIVAIAEESFDMDMVTISTIDNDIDVIISLKNKHDFAKYLKTFGKYGYRQLRKYTYDSSVVYVLENVKYKKTISLYFHVTSQSACRLVKTGITEVPKYELQCD